MMRKTMLLLVLLVSISSFAWADNKVSVESNVNSILTAKDYAQSDAKLMQKVSYEAKFRSVQLILDDLREMTGVRLVAGARDSDWVVRSRKMNIFVKDVPLSDLMDSIARVMKFRWSRNDNVKPSMYRLLIDKKAAAESDAMMKHAEKAKEAMWQARREEWIDAIMKYGSSSSSDLESLRESDPMVLMEVQRGSVRAICALFKEVPETKDRYAAGQSFRISADKLSEETKSLLFSAGNEVWKDLQRIKYVPSSDGEPNGYGDILKLEDNFDIVYKRLDVGNFTPNLRWGSANQTNTGYFHIEKDARDFQISGLKYRDCGRKSYQALEEDWKQQEESLYPSEPLVEHTAFPELDKSMKLKLELPGDNNSVTAINEYIAALQKAIADASGLDIVSDSWVNIQGETLSNVEMTIGETLDKFAKNYNYNWDKQGSILEFRHRKWAKMRLNQIPDEWVAAWNDNTQKNGYLSLDDLASMSSLTYEQAEECMKSDKVLGKTGIYDQILERLDVNLLWLQLYSSLTPQMKTLLTGSYGLNGFMLTSSQWKLAQPMFDRIGSTRGDAIFRMNVGDDKLTYKFVEIDTESDAEDRVWEVTLPTYTPPTGQEVTK